MIGRMLTAACEYVQPESIGDRPLMTALRVTARSRVVVHSDYGITYGLMVKGSYGIIPAHLCFFRNGLELRIETSEKFYDGVVISVSKVKDIACFKVTDKTFPAYRDITHWFVDKKMDDPTQRTAVLPIPYRSSDGLQVVRAGESMLYPVRFGKKVMSEYQTGRPSQVHHYSMLVGAEYGTLLSQKGDCGLPLVLTKTKGSRRIFGIHVAASSSIGYACCVTASELQEMMMVPEMIPRTPFSITRFTQKDHVVLADEPVQWKHGIRRLGYGTRFDSDEPFKYHASGKTQLYPSPLKISGKHFPEFEPACTGFRDNRGPKCDKLTLAFDKFQTVSPEFNMAEYMVSIRAITEDIAFIISKHQKKLKVFTNKEAINRNTLYECSNPLELNSSAGFPYNKMPGVLMKKPMISVCNEGDVPLYDIDRSCQEGRFLQSRISHFINECKAERRPVMIATACLKDEARPIEKIGKPRI